MVPEAICLSEIGCGIPDQRDQHGAARCQEWNWILAGSGSCSLVLWSFPRHVDFTENGMISMKIEYWVLSLYETRERGVKFPPYACSPPGQMTSLPVYRYALLLTARRSR